MVAILATVNEADNVNLVRSEGGVLPVFPMPITAAGVVSVGATAPITSTGGPAPVIGITPATELAAGSMSAADKTKLDNLSPSEVQSVAVVAPITLAGTAANPVVGFAGTDINASGQVDAISGPSPIPITPAVLQWTQATVAPTITQAQQLSTLPPNPIAITPSAPNAAATGANGVPANVSVNIAAPVGGTAEGFFQVTRAGALSSYLGCFPGAPTVIGCAWIGLQAATAPAATNFTLANEPANGTVILNGVSAASGLCTLAFFTDGATGRFLVGKDAAGGAGFDIAPGAATNWAGGVKVVGLNNATTEPTSNVATKTHFWAFTNGAFKWRSANGWQGNLAALGSGALNTQQPFVDTFSSAVRTVSSATPAAFNAYTTASNTIGWINVRLKSKAATTAGGITTGDGAFAEYRLGYKNVAGTVTLATAGITLLGSVQTTNALLTSVLTAAAAGATVVFSVTNVAGNTVDSLIDCTIDVC